ncbi:synphilin-1 isoform X2 [Microcaecilia unicolor]|uniref:Synphilin-1 isoform X2 n=1 Tax=Microcaecilia unicolor TaxID=1415580 RepID=A0A6P7XA71_9AMPH|nr:synphilin-1 isoform X2 [Microcaecilia unicolor]
MEAPEYLDLDEIDFSDDISTYTSALLCTAVLLGNHHKNSKAAWVSHDTSFLRTLQSPQLTLEYCHMPSFLQTTREEPEQRWERDHDLYSVTSLKTIPELCRRCDSQNEDRSVSNTNWNYGISTLIGSAQKPTGIADVYSKFRPVKRVSPLKHQPESPESNESDDQKEGNGDYQKISNFKNVPPTCEPCSGVEQDLKDKSTEHEISMGDLEHYDLDMDEILDVPYIKSNQQVTPCSKVALEKRTSVGCSTIKDKTGVGNMENLQDSATQFCVLSPVSSSELKKTQPIVLDHHRHLAGEVKPSQPLVRCGTVHDPETQSKSFFNRTFTDSHAQKLQKTMPNCQLRAFHLKTATAETKLDELNSNMNRCSPEEKGEDAKKIKSIFNIVKEGQISLLPHIAVDNLDKIHDESGNNLLHLAASHGHAECLQHLTSLMGEDCLNERNEDLLTPAGLAIKNGHLECVRWMVSETEAIAELSCSRDHPSLIHYAASYGQEKILLWLLQFMQEQGISLDEVDQDGNSAVHVASQHGYLGCIQTLVEYGANVTMQNQAGEKPSQSAEHHGHTTCSRYLVVVETCMSLASQVVKLTKQLKEQTTERVTLQNQLQQLLEAQKPGDKSMPTSPSSPSSPCSGGHQQKLCDPDDTSLQKNKPGSIQDGVPALGSAGTPGRLRPKAKDEDSDKILRQLLGKEISENVCPQKLSLEFLEGQGSSWSGKRMPPEKRELKLVRLRQLMQRSLSESDTDSNNSEDQKNTPTRKAEKPRPQPIVESMESTESLQLMIRKHTLEAAGRRFHFGTRASKSVDGHSSSPTSENSDPDFEAQYQAGSVSRNQIAGDASQSTADSAAAQKAATSPKSALKSPSSKRRTSQNLKLRVTFEEPVVQVEQVEPELSQEKNKDVSSKASQQVQPNSGDAGEPLKRPFGTFRSIMESLSGNQNSNNNCQTNNVSKTSTLPFTSLGRKAADPKANPVTSAKAKTKAV